MIDPRPFLRIVIAVSAAGGTISALESLHNGWAFRDGGPFSSSISRLRRPFARRLDYLESAFGFRGTMGTLGIRAVSGALCFGFACASSVPVPLLAVYVAATALFAVRSGYLFDGADRMFLVTAVACLLGALSRTGRGAESALFFLAAQSSLAYATAGAAKLRQPGWRNGATLRRLMSTNMFGHPGIQRCFRSHSSVARWSGIAIAMMEMLLSLAPWSPPRASLALLFLAGIFHCSVAAVMGLNTFLFAFPAVFPAVIYASQTLYGP